jgi:hypothetical protein
VDLTLFHHSCLWMLHAGLSLSLRVVEVTNCATLILFLL